MVEIESVEIVPVEVSEKTTWRHLLLRASDGSVGTGEYTTERAGAELDRQVWLRAEGMIGAPLDGCVAALVPAESHRHLADWTATSALDQALLDLDAQRKGQPLASYLGAGATEDSVPLYANINRRTSPRTPADFARSAAEALASGFEAIKIAPFDGVTAENCASADGNCLVDVGLERISAVRSALEGQADLYVDCHWRFSFERARALVAELSDLGVVWFECPIAETGEAIPNLKALRWRCADFGMRLAGCEMMNGTGGFEPFVRGGAYDVIMPDIKYCGGPREALRIVALADAANVACSLHNPSGPVAHLFSVHVSAASGSGERLEHQFDESPLFTRILNPGPEFQAGRARIPKGPGLGAELSSLANANPN